MCVDRASGVAILRADRLKYVRNLELTDATEAAA